MEPEKYYQYKFPMLYNALKAKPRVIPTYKYAEFKTFVSNYKIEPITVQISDVTLRRLLACYEKLTDFTKTGEEASLEDSLVGRLFANGFISAYNYCEEYAKKNGENFDFTPHANSLEEMNERNPPYNKKTVRPYTLNLGRIEGTRFYFSELKFKKGYDEIVLYKGNPATVKTDGSAIHTEGNPATCKTDGGTGHAEGNPTTGKTDEGTVHAEGISTKVNPLDDDSPMVNSEGLTLKQNLKPAPSSLRVFSSIEKLIKEYRKGNHRRTIVGYIIIAIRNDYVKPESNDSVLINAFYNDFYPDDEKERFYRFNKYSTQIL